MIQAENVGLACKSLIEEVLEAVGRGLVDLHLKTVFIGQLFTISKS